MPPVDTTAPSAPVSLTATANSSTQITLTWIASTDSVGVTGYQIFRNGGGSAIAQTTSLSYQDTGLIASTQYSYTVKAIDAAGNLSSTSNQAGATTQAPPDTTPPSVSITAPSVNLAAGTTQTNLSVTTSEAASCRYSTNSSFAFSSGTLFSTTGATTHTTLLAGLQNSTSYTYYVKCQDTASNTSGNASVAFAVAAPPDTTAPSVPSNLTATAISASQINLSWSPSTDAVGVTGYHVFRNGTQVGSPTTNSFSDTALSASTQYSYTVRATDAAGNNSSQSSAVSATTQSSGAGVTGILDSFPGATVVLSTSKESAAYGGAAFRLRRASDNSEQDIPFSGKDASVATFNSFCGGTTCFLRTWYDQSGNANHCQQPTANRQWQVTLHVDGKLALGTSSDGRGCEIADHASYKVSQPHAFIVLNGENDPSGPGEYQSLVGYMPTGSAENVSRWGIGWQPGDSDGLIYAVRGGSVVKTISGHAHKRSNTNDFTIWDHSAFDQQVLVDVSHLLNTSSGRTSANVTYPAAGKLMIGNNQGYTNNFHGKMRAVVLYPSTRADRQSISAALKASVGAASIPWTFTKDGFTWTPDFAVGWIQDPIDQHGFRWLHEYGGYDWSFAKAQTNNNVELVRFEVRPGDTDTIVTGAERSERSGNPNGQDIVKGGDYELFAQFKFEPGPVQNADWQVVFQIHYGEGSDPDIFLLDIKNDQFVIETQRAGGGYTSSPMPFQRNIWYAMRVSGHWSTNGTSDTLQVWLGPNGSALPKIVDTVGALYSTTASTAYFKQGIYRGWTGNGNVAMQIANHKGSVTIGAFASHVNAQPPLPSNGAGPDTQAPSIPAGLTASVVSANQVNLAWSASSDNVGVANYQVFRNGTLVASPYATAFSDTGLTSGTTYTYTVKAVDLSSNASAASSAVFATPQSTVSGPTVTMGETGVLPGTDTGNGNYLLSQSATLAQPGTLRTMSFYVQNPAGELRLGVYDATGASGGPGNLLAETYPFTPVAGWNTANIVNPVALAAGNYWLAYHPSDSALSFTATGGGGTHKYYQRTFGNMPAAFSGTHTTAAGHWSLYATLTTAGTADTTAPSTPTGLTASAASASQINLNWSASTDNVGVAGYRVFRNGSQIATPTGTSYSDSGLSASTQYSYTVSAVDAAGNASAQSGSVSATTQTVSPPTDTTAPTISISAPSGQLSAGTTQTSLTVSTNENATCSYATTAGVAFTSMTGFSSTGGTSHGATLSGLANGSSYTYYVKCRDSAGNISADSLANFSVAAGGGGGGSVTMGLTSVAASDNSGDGNLLIAHKVTLSQSATLQSLSFYVTTAAGQLRLGIYDATGAGGDPGTLKAQTNAFTPTSGWNTQAVVSPVLLPAGDYWLVYHPSSNSLGFKTDFSVTNNARSMSQAFGPLPSTFSTENTWPGAWSFYGTLTQ